MTKPFLDLTHSKLCDTCGTRFYRDKRCTWKWWHSARFCSRKCSAIHLSNLCAERTPDLKTAFDRRVVVGPPDECWRWNGCTDKDGYPLVMFRGKSYRANRVALILAGRAASDDQMACHTCGNAWCVNPSHIYAGTAKENARDKIAHGTHRAGRQCSAAKLTEADVIEIRASSGTNAALSERFNISPSNISMIRRRKTWRHVP